MGPRWPSSRRCRGSNLGRPAARCRPSTWAASPVKRAGSTREETSIQNQLHTSCAPPSETRDQTLATSIGMRHIDSEVPTLSVLPLGLHTSAGPAISLEASRPPHRDRPLQDRDQHTTITLCGGPYMGANIAPS